MAGAGAAVACLASTLTSSSPFYAASAFSHPLYPALVSPAKLRQLSQPT